MQRQCSKWLDKIHWCDSLKTSWTKSHTIYMQAPLNTKYMISWSFHPSCIAISASVLSYSQWMWRVLEDAAVLLSNSVLFTHTCCLKRDCGTFGQHRSQKNPSSEPAPTNWAKCARRISWLRSSRPGRLRTATRFFWHLPFFRLTSYRQQRWTRAVSAGPCFTLPRVASVNTPAAGRALRVITLSHDWRTEARGVFSAQYGL